MAHIATKRFTYWGQLGILMLLAGVGFLIAQGISLVVLITKFPDLLSSLNTIMDRLLVPANANLFRILQLVAVIFMFILPVWIYAKLCHKKAALHLGIQKNLYIPQLILAILLMFSALPLVGALREFTLHLPLGDYIKHKIVQSKDDYMKQVMVIGAMKNLGDYLATLFIMAILPGFAEELFFRGAIQNLFTRWFKNPVAAILLSAFIFSAFHFEYSDFLGRFFLGIVLGWVFYLTGNLWLNIMMHAAFNALSVTGLYITSQTNGKIDTSNVEDNFSIYVMIIASAAFIALGYFFYKLNKKKNQDVPGEEILLPGYINPRDPFANDTNEIGNQNPV